MKILVTGGAGFIGSHLCNRLHSQKHAVVAFDNLSGGRRSNLNSKVPLIVGDIRDRCLVDSLVAEHEFDVVYHLAAYAAECLSHWIRYYNYEVNLLGSINILNASIKYGAKKFIFTSSAAVYGDIETPFKETDTPCPIDPYGIAKLAVERDLACANAIFGLDYTIFRLHNVFGPRQSTVDRYRNVIGIFMHKLAKDKPLPVFGSGMQTRCFTYIDYVIDAFLAVLHRDVQARVINLGSDEECAIIELASKMCDISGKLRHMEFLPARHEVPAVRCDHSLAYALFGAPTISFEDGLRETLSKIETGQVSKFYGLELTEGLPESWK